MDIQFWISLFESKNCYLNSKYLFDLKVDIWILNFLKKSTLIFQFWKLLIEFLRFSSIGVIHNKSLL
jgi:hypothetical protein